MAKAIGSPEYPYSASLCVLDDTGLTITVTTGGTYQGVLHASTMVKGASDVGLTSAPSTGTISVPVGASGRYRVTCSGVALPTNSKTVLLRLAVDGSNLANNAGGAGARIVGAATALEEHFSFASFVDVDTSAAAKAFRINVTSTTDSDTVNFKRFNFTVERIGG